MQTIENSVVTAMDNSGKELFPLFTLYYARCMGVWANPEAIIKLIKKHPNNHDDLNILDLGCGKGAVSVKNWQKHLTMHILIL